MNTNPDFGQFEITSVAVRKRWSNGFLALCAATSTLSIVILVVLITTIIFSALPVFGPHSDKLETESRMLFAQGNSGNEETLDTGDQIQGIFRAKEYKRGGLGRNNDEVYVEGDGTVNKTAIGFYAFQLTDDEEGNTRLLEPARDEGSIRNLLETLGVETESDLTDASIAILTSPTAEVSIKDLEVEGSLQNGKLLEELGKTGDWSLQLVAGQKNEQDFAEIRFSDTNRGELDKLKKTRVRKSAGNLKVLASVLFSRDYDIDDFYDVKLRSWTTNGIGTSQVRVDGSSLTGISRRQRNGFDLASNFDLQWTAEPEGDASALQHAAHFMSAIPSDSEPSECGIGPALWGSIWVCTFCALFALPLGIGTAIFLEEFKPNHRILRFFQNLIQLNITNLAGVPSIVYGILGLTAFATMFGIFGSDKEPEYQIGATHYYQYLTVSNEPVLIPVDSPNTVPTLAGQMEATDGNYQPVTLNVIGPDNDLPESEEARKWTIRSDSQGGLVSDRPWYYFQLPFGRGVLAASLTLMLVILPVIIIASQEAIKAVPSSLREGAMGLGSTRWQVVRNVTLPAAIPGIMTGAILSVSRAIGEAAPIIVLCGTVFIATSPSHLMDFYSVLPIRIYHVTGLPVTEDSLVNFQNVAAASSLVLLAVLLTFNTIAIVLRQMTSKPLS